MHQQHACRCALTLTRFSGTHGLLCDVVNSLVQLLMIYLVYDVHTVAMRTFVGFSQFLHARICIHIDMWLLIYYGLTLLSWEEFWHLLEMIVSAPFLEDCRFAMALRGAVEAAFLEHLEHSCSLFPPARSINLTYPSTDVFVFCVLIYAYTYIYKYIYTCTLPDV